MAGLTDAAFSPLAPARPAAKVFEMTAEIRFEDTEDLDPVRTSALARSAFHKSGPELSPERFAWTYREGYDRTKIVSAYADGQKVGQLAAFFKTVDIGGERQTAAELVDLFVTPEFRSFQIVSSLYKELRKAVVSEGASLIYAYANDAASLLNKRFFKMEEVTQLPARMGLSAGILSLSSGSGIVIHRDKDAMASLHADLSGGDGGGGLAWTRDQFRRRISSPIYRYAMASDGDVAILASPRVIRSVPVLLICATFTRGGKTTGSRSIPALVASLCKATRRNLYLHVGWNDAIGFDRGFTLPDKALRGKFLMQSNFLNSRRDGIRRFELLDVDYG